MLLEFKPAYEELSDAVVIEPVGDFNINTAELALIIRNSSKNINNFKYNQERQEETMSDSEEELVLAPIVAESTRTLALPNYCHMCEVTLRSQRATKSHYKSKRHRNKIVKFLKSTQDLDEIVKKKVEKLTKSGHCYICKIYLLSQHTAAAHYESGRHKSNIAAYRDDIINNLRSKQKAVEDKSYCCLPCKFKVYSKKLYETHIQGWVHKFYTNEKSKGYKRFDIDSNDCNVTEGENKTGACYNTNEKESVTDDLETQAIKPVINNRETLEKNDTNQKEPVIDVSTNKFADNNASDSLYSDDTEDDSSINSDVCDTLLEFKPAPYAHEELSDAIVIESVTSDINTAELALNINSSSKSVDNSKYNQGRPEEVMSKSEQDLEAIIKEKIEDLSLPDYCYICKVNPTYHSYHYYSKAHEDGIARYRAEVLNYIESGQPDLEAIVKEKIKNLTLPDHCHICKTKLPHSPRLHYMSYRHLRNVAAYKVEIVNNMKGEQQEAVEDKSYCCPLCNITVTCQVLYEMHVQSSMHSFYFPEVKSNNNHKPIVNINSNDCNITEGENETPAGYNSNEEKPVIDDLETQEIKPDINNGEILEKNDTNQKEPVIDVSTNKFADNNASDKLYSDDTEDDSSINSDVCDTLLEFKPAVYAHEELSDKIVIESVTSDINTAELALNISSSSKSVDNSKYNQGRPEEVMSKSEQDLDAIVKEKIENLILPDYCYICRANLMSPVDATSHYNSKRHEYGIAGYRVEILNNLESGQQDLKTIAKERIVNLTLPDYCYVCKVNLMSPGYAASHYKSKMHKRFFKVRRDEIVNNPKSEQQEAVEDKREMGIKLSINNEEKLEKNDTNQKEHVTDISINEIRCADNNASNTYKSDSSIHSDVSDTLVEFKPPALYAHEELPDAIVMEPVASDINTAELALNISSSSKSVDNSKHNEDRPEEFMSKSEQDLEVIVKRKIDNWTLPDFCYICMINLMWPGRAEFHYNSDRHKRNIAVYRDELLNYLKSQQTLKTIENGRYKAVEGESNDHKLYASAEKNNYGSDIVNINSNDCNTTEGENETAACYSSNEEEPVIDDLETREINSDLNNGEMLEKNDTNQKEPVINISTNKFADNNARDIHKLHSYVDDTEDNSSINSVVSDTLPQSDANVGEINAAELALDIKNSSKTIDNSKYDQDRQEEIMSLSEQDLEAIVKKKLENLTLPHYCHICKTNLTTPDRATNHYKSRRHERHIATHRNKIFYDLKSERQEAVEGKSYSCLVCDIELNSKELYETHVESCIHESYASLVKSINSHESIVNINSREGNNSLKSIDNSKFNQDRPEEGMRNSEQDLEAIVKEKIDSLTLMDYCYICLVNLRSLVDATSHYNSKWHKCNIATYTDVLKNLKSEQDIEAIVNEKINNLTLPTYCHICKASLKLSHNAESHYNSERHVHGIRVYRDEILNNLISAQQELKSKKLYETHVESRINESYVSLVKSNNSQETIININSQECSINKGKNETAACYNTNEKEPVVDDLETQEIRPVINNGDMLEKINTNQNEPYVCKANLMSPGSATSQYVSESHKCNFAVRGGEIAKKVESELHKAVDRKSYYCHICNIRTSKMSYSDHVQSAGHQLYASLANTNFDHTRIVKVYSNDCNITKGANETTPCYNASEKEPVLDDLEKHEFNPDINNGEMLEKVNTHQKEPVIDISTNEIEFAGNNPHDIYKLHSNYVDDSEDDSSVNSDVRDTLLQFKPALYTYEELLDAFVVEPEAEVDNTAESALNVSNSSRNIENSKYNQARQEEILELALEPIVKEIIDKLTLPYYCHMCRANLTSQHNATAHYKSRKHRRLNGGYRKKVLNDLKNKQQEGLEGRSYCCLVCNIELKSKELYETHVQSCVHKAYASLGKRNNRHKPIVNINSSDCNIIEGENETAACYNTNEKEPVIDYLEKHEINCDINNGEMWEQINTNQKEPVINDLEKNEIEIVVNNEEILDQNNEQLKDTFIEISDIENWIIDKHKNEIIAILKQKFSNCEKTECYKLQSEVFLHLKQIIDKIYCADSPPLVETLKVLESVHKNLHNPVQIREEKFTQLKTDKVSEVEPFKRQSTSRFGYVNLTVMATATATVTGCIWWLIKKRQ